MITEPATIRHTPRWQRELADAISDPEELLRLLELPASWLPGARAAAAAFPLRVPRVFAARMRRADPADALLRQVLPLGAELEAVPGYRVDPLDERAATVVPGVLQKYRGRALLTLTGACAVHCRYCFRRHFPYAESNPAQDDWRPALAYLQAERSLHEVILSGGDPLALADSRLTRLVSRLEQIEHLRRLRIHTRLPIVLPSRVDPDLLAWIGRTRFKVVVVLHANHPREIDAEVERACARLGGTGATLLNQSVLLRGVNDDADVLAALSERLFEAGVLPYYLHLFDRVQGGAHFEVDERRAAELIAAVSERLPGYLVPRLARELAGAPAKLTPIPETLAAVCADQ